MDVSFSYCSLGPFSQKNPFKAIQTCATARRPVDCEVPALVLSRCYAGSVFSRRSRVKVCARVFIGMSVCGILWPQIALAISRTPSRRCRRSNRPPATAGATTIDAPTSNRTVPSSSHAACSTKSQ